MKEILNLHLVSERVSSDKIRQNNNNQVRMLSRKFNSTLKLENGSRKRLLFVAEHNLLVNRASVKVNIWLRANTKYSAGSASSNQCREEVPLLQRTQSQQQPHNYGRRWRCERNNYPEWHCSDQRIRAHHRSRPGRSVHDRSGEIGHWSNVEVSKIGWQIRPENCSTLRREAMIFDECVTFV